MRTIQQVGVRGAVVVAAVAAMVLGGPVLANAESPSSTPSPTSLKFLSAAEYEKLTGKEVPNSLSETKSRSAKGPDVRPMDPPQAWYLVAYSTLDSEGRDWPTRQGNSDLGRAHFADAHNLYNYRAIIAAYQSGDPVVEDGSHFEYHTYLTDMSDGSLEAVVRVVGEQNETTSDGRYTTPDGRPIGTITAYCENQPNNRCPDIVNQS